MENNNETRLNILWDNLNDEDKLNILIMIEQGSKLDAVNRFRFTASVYNIPVIAYFNFLNKKYHEENTKIN